MRHMSPRVFVTTYMVVALILIVALALFIISAPT